MVELVDSQNLDSRKLQFSKCVCFKNCWNGWIDSLYWLFSINSLKILLTKLNFQKMYVVNSGWIGWFAKSGFSQTPIFKLCVLQKLLKWLTCHFLATVLLTGYIINIPVASSGWMVELPFLAKIISRETNFSNYVCRI